MEEGVAVLRKLWSEPRVTHHGRFYRFDDVTIEPRPARGPLDVWIGGRTDVALKRVARYGDGWFPSFITAEEFRTGMADSSSPTAPSAAAAIDPREAGIVLLTYVTRRSRARRRRCCSSPPPTSSSRPRRWRARCAIGSAEECVARLQALRRRRLHQVRALPARAAGRAGRADRALRTRIIPRFER